MNLNELLTITDDMISKDMIMKLEPYIGEDLIISNTKIVSIPKGKTKTFTGNFYGLLKNELKIDSKYWYVNMRVNGYRSPMEYKGEDKIKVVNSDILDLLIKK